MENRIWNQKVRGNTNAKQNTGTHNDRGFIGDRSTNLIKLIGAERVSRRNYKYEGKCYVSEDGELCSKYCVTSKKAQRTGVSFYEVTDWEFNEERKLFLPTIRRIVVIKNNITQLSLNL